MYLVGQFSDEETITEEKSLPSSSEAVEYNTMRRVIEAYGNVKYSIFSALNQIEIFVNERAVNEKADQNIFRL